MERITVQEAAARLKVADETIRQGMRNGDFPIGCVIRMSKHRSVYIIPKKAFNTWMETGFVKEEA